MSWAIETPAPMCLGKGDPSTSGEPALGGAAAAGCEQLCCGAVTAATRRCGQLDRP